MHGVNFAFEILTLCIMKGISKLSWLTFIVCLMSVLSATAEDCQTPKTESPTRSGEGILYSLEYNTDRKRMPSRDVLELYYEGGILMIDSPTLGGEFSLLISNEETEHIEYLSTVLVGASIGIELNSGVYSISAFSLTGKEFKGKMTIY